VLLVERDVHSLVAIAAQLEALGVRVQTAADGEEALETLQDERDCALLLLAFPASPLDSCDTIMRVRAEAASRTADRRPRRGRSGATSAMHRSRRLRLPGEAHCHRGIAALDDAAEGAGQTRRQRALDETARMAAHPSDSDNAPRRQ
jgi:CheY-like chemotaxis protein